ncbi:hypothetical protein COEREDRAFT_6918 [Coemansia reversa NRRL 1564]|uniref:Uncharacterized protein n=1 Tax=Coemansia reversa (strain ATCC 12441 / NRRL 1564) TaxID=763665 RepID=A0A2G5BGN6_COERN|nr:hypothetical protein COEREDRAFT_6918 [Coemansia reversa NRRL 1564]|eukprot:PIA18184.1 hypothetical protein COEREDRAFT_6918 [Coemansia reversa NRRL 1564]
MAPRAFYRAPIPSFVPPSDSTNTGTSTIVTTSPHLVADVSYTPPTHIHIQTLKHESNNLPDCVLDSPHSELDIEIAHPSVDITSYTSTGLADVSSLINPASYDNHFSEIEQLFATQHGAIQTESVCDDNIGRLVAGHLMSIKRVVEELQAENSQLKAQLAILTTSLELRNNESLSDEGYNKEFIEDYGDDCEDGCSGYCDEDCAEDCNESGDEGYNEEYIEDYSDDCENGCNEDCDGNNIEDCNKSGDENYVEDCVEDCDGDYVQGCDKDCAEDCSESGDKNYAEDCTKSSDGSYIENCDGDYVKGSDGNWSGDCDWGCDISTTGTCSSLILEMAAINKECDYILQELDREELLSKEF